MLRRKASCFPAAGFLFLTTVLSLLADSLCQRPTPTGSNAAERHSRHSQAIVSVDKHGSSLDVADSSSSKLDGGENGRPRVDTVTEYSRGDVSYPKETTNLDAIVMLHSLLDDDHNGNVDPSESNEFLRDELQYTSGYERSAAVFHGGDKLVSVDDLWRTWRMSSVYNWTVEDVVEWLVYHVELPQYADLFTLHSVDGTQLPRLATNNYNYISAILGIKNPVHKQKLSLKATDVVLFGPPKKGHSYVKDAAVVTSLVVAVVGCWFAYYQHRYSKGQVRRMMKDMESLQKAEDTLTEMQNKLEKAEKEQMSVSEEKKNLEQKYREEIETAKVEAERLKIAREGSLEEMSRLKLAEEELKQVRSALKRAEKQLELRQGVIPAELQPYLQLTHEIELQNYHSKRQAAEKQLVAARDECERIRRKRNTVMGALRMNSVDEVDQRIATARAALEEVRVTLTERLHRWAAMEHLCGFNIVTNNGLASLCARLQRDILPSGIVAYGLAGAARSTMAIPFLGPAKLEVDMDVNEDLPPSYSTATASLYNSSYVNGCVKTFNPYKVVSPVEVLKKVSGSGGVLTKRGNSKDGSRRSSLSTIPDESNLNDNNSAAADARVTFNLGENSGEEKVNTSPKSHIHNGIPSVNGKMTKSKSHFIISNQGVNGASILNGVDMSSRRSDPNLSRPRGNSLTSDSLSGAESTDSAAETEKRKGEKDKKRRKFLHNFLKKDKSS